MGNKTYNIIIILLVVVIVFTVRRCDTIKRDLNISTQNSIALSDTIRYSKNLIGGLEANKNILISEKKYLSKINSELAKELSKEKGKVLELTKMNIELNRVDTVFIETTLIKYSDTLYAFKWDYDTLFSPGNSRQISGLTRFYFNDGELKPRNTLITKDILNFDLVTGLKDNKGNIEIFVRSNHPNFNLTNLDGAIIDPKKNPIIKKYINKRKWGVGPNIGIGVSSELKPKLYFGFGLQYNIIRF